MRAPLAIQRSIATLALLCCAHGTHAIAPAIPESIICRSGHLFTGKILGVESRDCKLRSSGWCSPRDAMVVHLRIDRVLRTIPLPEYLAAASSVEAGRELRMYVFAFTSGANRYPGLLREDEVPVPMTSTWLNERLAGKALLFSASSQPSGLPDGPPLLIGSTLPIESVSWVEDTLRDSCGPPGPTRKSEGLWPNLAIDTDVLSAGDRPPTVRRSFLR